MNLGKSTGWLGWALVLYAAAAVLGVVLRARYLVTVPGPPFRHLLHAHSHTLFFGWTGLAVFVLAFREAGAEARWIPAGMVAGSVLALGAFLQGGYSPASIAVSTVFLVLWYAGMAVWWKASRARAGVGVAYLRVAMAYLGLATLGAWARVALRVLDVGGRLAADLAVHAFLQEFARFLLFAVIGLLAAFGPSLGLRLDEGLLRRQLRWAAPLAWLTFPLGVEGGAAVPWLGSAARMAALVLLYPASLWVANLLGAARRANRGRAAWAGWLALWFGFQAVLEAGAATIPPSWLGAAVAARHPLVL